MQPELEEGNIEYKLKLTNKDDIRINELVSQMRYRCDQGNGECIYNIGVNNEGGFEGITEEEYIETIKNINLIAGKNNYYVSLLSTHNLDNNKKIYEVLIRENNNNNYVDIKVVVAGSVDAGKSSTVSCITTGCLDNGRGSARSKVFNYIHELKTGRTSSIAQHIMGFDNNGNPLYCDEKTSWSDIVNKSRKVISFFDLAGHEKYLKTTILGMSSSYPDICFILISANNGVNNITKEHIFLCITLKIPFVIIINKIDICEDRKNVLENTIASVNKILKFPGVRRMAINVKNIDDIVLSVKNIYSESVVPIFYISNITGQGLEHLKQFLNIIGKRNTNDHKNDDVEYHVDNIFNVYGFGLVVGGQLLKGTIKVGDKLLLGPNKDEYQNFVVKSLYCKKISVQEVSCGSYVCIGIKKKIKVKRGNVIIGDKQAKLCIKRFVADVNVLKSHSTTIKIGYEPILHTSSIRETVKIIDIKNKKNSRNVNSDEDYILRSGDTASVTFEFKYNSNFLKVNTNIILCEGITKIVGKITEV